MKFEEILNDFRIGKPITRVVFQKLYRECETYSYRYVLKRPNETCGEFKRYIEVGDAYSLPRYYDAFSLDDIFADDWIVNLNYKPREVEIPKVEGLANENN